MKASIAEVALHLIQLQVPLRSPCYAFPSQKQIQWLVLAVEGAFGSFMKK